MIQNIYLNLCSKIDSVIIFLIFLQYALLGYKSFLANFVELILIFLILLDFKEFKISFKLIIILITLLLLIDSDFFSNERIISYKNLMIFL